ncbi:PSP1 C-terminal conserved region-domain-containing protein [Ephemerocybe angulata]|uniref:PSP1 C-terminal conserved region-domain-containing protein n=1 Tax=Ephemerocybe angulata TaxID=980116 RepID=A0A8H6LT66_9AGAR|nr:PSP1 C-terminal conserved region-domain-containing protein [Tulosesus angulatus]
MSALDQDYEEVYTQFNTAYSGRLAAQSLYDEDDRNNRFQPSSVTDTTGRTSLRDRAASQPPRSSEQGYLSSPGSQHFVPSSLGGSGSPWSGSRLVSSNGRGQPMPIRSSSLTSQNQNQFGSVMRERAFPSTLEDDEPEDYDEVYDEHFVPPSLSRGRSYGQEFSRSRSQSLANTRPGPVGSPYLGGSAMQSFNESYLSSNNVQSNPLNISSGGRGYDNLQPSGTSRYGSLGTLARSPSNNFSSSPSPGGVLSGNGYSRLGPTADGSNMSPFRRDVGQILLDDGPFRELWQGMNPPRDESGGGGGSGTTSRRHSVSVVQPRRGLVQGFNAPDNDTGNDSPSLTKYSTSAFPRRGLVLSDDDLADDLGMLNLGPGDATPLGSNSQHPPSQPASLPIYAPLSRSPPSKELFQPMVNIPANSYSVSRAIGTPSDNGNDSPVTRTSGYFENDQYYAPVSKPAQRTQQQHELTARYVPGHGIQYINANGQIAGNGNPPGLSLNPQYNRARAPSYSSQSGGLTSPISPSGTRLINPQQQPYYPQQMQRRSSDASQPGPGGPQPNLNELGKGVPLSAVPPSCPLYIVGDVVIVEADRGKDLGKVVNDTITLGEVEAFQKQQAEEGCGCGGDGPGGAGGAKKEINPKMIYGKASPHDTQLLATKLGDEQKALQLCQSKVRAKKLPMEVIDAEYQWDRRKLTFYFVAEKRIDFRELVRELFRLYKTRIWMASLQGPNGYEQ